MTTRVSALTFLDSERSPCNEVTESSRSSPSKSKPSPGSCLTSKTSMYLTSGRFKQLQSTGEQAHLKDNFPSSKRGNNIEWHTGQNGQTATEQPAQTQVEHVYRQLSGRRGVRVLCSHSGNISKSKHRMKLRLVRTGARREFRSVTTPRY